ncbi:MAG TPA: hypothetical protein VK789_28220 [Bryobacteraceae bacterium]|jgi:hypothetical protein|nr:hypothetical protein [Bryobacteraceae bacterium]
MTEQHTPLILENHSGCSCRWNGPARESGETQGAFTVRAYEAHRAHIENPTEGKQESLFTADQVGFGGVSI